MAWGTNTPVRNRMCGCTLTDMHAEASALLAGLPELRRDRLSYRELLKQEERRLCERWPSKEAEALYHGG